MILRLLPILLAMPLLLSATEIIAHRGASKDAPENTLAAVRLGYEQGADACEIDIRLTKDGQIALMHDATAKRTTGREGAIDAMTMAELRQLSAGAWKGEQWKDEKVPTLAEVLALIPAGRQLFIEVKCGPEILPELQRVIAASGVKPEQLVIISFKFDVVRSTRTTMPKIDTYFLASAKPDKVTGEIPSLATLIRKAKDAGLTGLDLDFKFPIDAALVNTLKEAGLKLQVWTVDQPADAKRLAAAGVQGITTNRPAFLREQMQRGPSGTP